MAASLGSAATEILRPLYPCYRAEPSRLPSGSDGARVTRDGFMLSKDLAWKSASSADTENCRCWKPTLLSKTLRKIQPATPLI